MQLAIGQVCPASTISSRDTDHAVYAAYDTYTSKLTLTSCRWPFDCTIFDARPGAVEQECAVNLTAAEMRSLLGAYTFLLIVGEIGSLFGPRDLDPLQHLDNKYMRPRAQLDGSGDTLRKHSRGHHP